MLEIPGVLTPEEVAHWRDRLERASWRDGRLTAGHVAVHAKRNQQLADDDPLVAELGDFIRDRLGRTERFMAAALPLKILPPRFNRYAGSGAYDAHIDNAVFTVPGAGRHVRSDLSATLFFSDPESYDGGELVVTGAARPIRLPAGHMLLYSATTLHQVRPVTRGARLAAFFWIESMVRDDDRRAVLLDLDDAIRALRAETPGHKEVVRLTRVYHNLLRQWAHV